MARPPAQKRRIGRPPKGGVGKRSAFNTRLRTDLKQKLEAEAQTAGRSLSEEIESRLELSLAGETARLEKEQAELGGPHNYALAKTIGFVASFVESATGESWVDNKVSREHLEEAITTVLDRLKTPSVTSIEAPAPLLVMIDELGPVELRGHVGAVVAENLLDHICMSKPSPKSKNVHLSRELQVADQLAPYMGDLLQPVGSRKGPFRGKKR